MLRACRTPLRDSVRAITCLAVLLSPTSSGSAENGTMVAHFVDVGQANATLLEFPCGAVLVDAGAQDDAHVDALTAYLEGIFGRRPDLKRTIDLVLITHNHIDHTRALRAVAEKFRVKRYVDNGQLEGMGTANPNWIRKNADTGGRRIEFKDISDELIADISPRQGLTDSFIDPIQCGTVDPKIRILHARLGENPGWSNEAFGNKNNHSLVTRVDFGEASFLFTGDLEKEAIDDMVSFYEDEEPNPLDVDVYEVGHHGSHNGTTVELASMISPEIAVVSMGKWDFGRKPFKRFTTFAYGHPRRGVIDMLSLAIQGRRSEAATFRVAEAAKVFDDYRVRKRIYGTGWEGTIRVRAYTDGRFMVSSLGN